MGWGNVTRATETNSEAFFDCSPTWLEDAMPQSNVVATARRAWPWLELLSVGAYMGISPRRQKSQRRT